MGDNLDHSYANVGGDFNDHLKTYKGFLNLIAFSAAAAVATLVILFFSLAH